MKFVVIIMFFLLNITFVHAEEKAGYIDNVQVQINGVDNSLIKDNNFYTIETIAGGNTISITSTKNFDKIYIIYSVQSSKGTISYNGKEKSIGKNMFLHELIELEEVTNKIEIAYKSDVSIKEIYLFSDSIPNWVQKWEPTLHEADALLFSAHSDDEHIFFAGLIPHILNQGKSIQIVYLTRHLKTPIRFDELLDGLWAVGIRNYPIIGPVPDAFSKSTDMALENLKLANMTIEDIVHFEVDMIRKFKPKIVISHDERGEYGHGQHRLTTYALEKSIDYLNDPDYESVYTPYMPYKIYLHLYKENPIVMDYDIPLDKYEGKTAFRVSMEGLSKHPSQLKLIWGKWLKYESVDEVKEYNPKYFGLYYSRVGYDNKDNDMFYNIPTKQLMDYNPELITTRNDLKITTKKMEYHKIEKTYIYLCAIIIIFLLIIDLYIIAKK